MDFGSIRKAGFVGGLIISISCFQACKHTPFSSSERLREVFELAGSNKAQLLAALEHYSEPRDSLKRTAMFFLVENMIDQFHYRGIGIQQYRNVFSRFDSLNTLKQIDARRLWLNIKDTLNVPSIETVSAVPDAKYITASYLINNVEGAFKSWSYPWARRLSFSEFCEYILPYKLHNEQFENWRDPLQNKYRWVLDSINDIRSSKEACLLINQDLRKWFKVTPFETNWDLSYTDLITFKSGRCQEASEMTAYAMRAMGIPVSLDYCSWANRSSGHQWNALLDNGKWIPFMGSESNPGVYKIQFTQWGLMSRRRAKVLRKTFSVRDIEIQEANGEDFADEAANRRAIDVSNSYFPVTDVTLDLRPPPDGIKYCSLATFDNQSWRLVATSAISLFNSATFRGLGRNIVYLPLASSDGTISPLEHPLLIDESGQIRLIVCNVNSTRTVKLTKKYPEDESNNIFAGEHYELFYWNDGWVSLGRKKAESSVLTFTQVPEDALLWLRNLDKGLQERIFTYQGDKQIWW
jgi:hypothetical protein